MNRSATALIATTVLLVAAGCTAEAEAEGPMGLLPGETGCQLSVGNSAETAVIDPNEYGPLRAGQNETRSTGSGISQFWEAEAMVAGGQLLVRMSQGNGEAQAQGWPIADIPSTGVMMTGPWGGPYEEGSPEGSTFFFTCWTNLPD